MIKIPVGRILLALAHTSCANDRVNGLAVSFMKFNSTVNTGNFLPIGKLLAMARNLPDVSVTVGDEVTLLDYQVGEQCTVKIVDPESSDPDRGIISCRSPLGAALLGARIGEAREVGIFGNRFVFQILRIG